MSDNNPFEAPRTESIEQSIEHVKFGGIGRDIYIVSALVVLIGYGIIFNGMDSILNSPVHFNIAILALGIELFLLALKLKNIGMNPLYWLLALVPVFNVIVIMRAIVMPPGYEHTDELDIYSYILFASLSLFVLVWWKFAGNIM